MTRILPVATDKLNNSSHSFLHRVISVDSGSPQSSIDVASDGSATLLANPVTTTQTFGDSSTKIATTAFVAAAVLGQNFKEAVKYASIAALPSIVYANGSSGVGATLTGVALAAISLDSSSPAVNDRVLIKNQVSTFQNGIYTVTATGSGIAVFVLTRATDANQSGEFKTGDSVFVTAGSTLSTTTWAYNGVDSPTIGTDALTFVQTAGQGSFTAGNGITITGVSIALTNSTISGVALGGTLGALTATDTTVTFSGSYDGSTARTIGLNLGNINIWTAQQKFNFAPSGGSGTSNAFSSIFTMPTTLSSTTYGVLIQPTGAGSSSFISQALRVDYLAGYTGSSGTQAGVFVNRNAGTGNTLPYYSGASGAFNSGINSVVIGTTTGLNINFYSAENGSRNIGIMGNATVAKNSATNIGVMGAGLNTGSTPVQIGGWFQLGNTDLTFESAALVADNGSTSSPVFLARVNGTTDFRINSSGNIDIGTWNGTIITSVYGGTGNGFTKFSGPASSEKTFTLPNVSAAILTDNALVTVAQGGSGAGTFTAHGVLLGEGTGAFAVTAVGSNGQLLIGQTSADPTWNTVSGDVTITNAGVTSINTSTSFLFIERLIGLGC